MKAAVSLIFILLIAFPSAGRAGGLLWEMYDTCLSRLGEPVNHAVVNAPPASDVYAFQQGAWSVTIFFWKHQAHLVIYQKANESRLTSLEMDAILRGYSDQFEWTKDTAGHCERSDGIMRARVTSNMVAIYSSDFDVAASVASRH